MRSDKIYFEKLGDVTKECPKSSGQPTDAPNFYSSKLFKNFEVTPLSFVFLFNPRINEGIVIENSEAFNGKGSLFQIICIFAEYFRKIILVPREKTPKFWVLNIFLSLK